MSGVFGKKQVLLATLVLALGLAVYLNYYFSNQNPITVDTNTSTTSTVSNDNLGDAQYVNGTTAVADSSNSSDYFVQARLNRESARQEALDIVKDLMNDVKATDEVKKEAVAKATAIATAVEQENKIESLVKAKGFADCVVYIEDKTCHIVVRSEGLQPQQTIQITEIITAQSDIVAQNINIVPVK
jgi:stage III sporulation protein AH